MIEVSSTLVKPMTDTLYSPLDMARYIDHTALKPDVTDAQIEQLCAEARQYHFAAVCVNPVQVARCARALAGADVRVAAVIGFPLGANLPEVKAYETQQVIAAGAREIDMVINVGALKSGEEARVESDIRAVVEAAHAGGAITKVIIETALLIDAEKITACRLAQQAGAEFVKTSTGFAAHGATVQDVTLMRQTVGPEMGVKAAGGIKTYQDALRMIEAGANRIGASAGVAIMREAQQRVSR